jgi:heptaprenyl diphosphate synthase
MKHKPSATKKAAFLGLGTALSLLFSYVEVLMPPLYAAVPGIKLGLPNIVVLYLLYALGFRYAALVSLARVAISSLLFGNVMTLAYSAAGAVLSLCVMWLLKKTAFLSEVGVSVAGGVTHNLGQVLVAILLLDTPQIGYYMLVLTVTGTISGICIGLCGAYLLRRLPHEKFFRF